MPGSQLPSLLHVVKEAFTHHPPPVFVPSERMGQPGSQKHTQGSLNLAIAFPICQVHPHNDISVRVLKQ